MSNDSRRPDRSRAPRRVAEEPLLLTRPQKEVPPLRAFGPPVGDDGGTTVRFPPIPSKPVRGRSTMIALYGFGRVHRKVIGETCEWNEHCRRPGCPTASTRSITPRASSTARPMAGSAASNWCRRSTTLQVQTASGAPKRMVWAGSPLGRTTISISQPAARRKRMIRSIE